MLISPPAQPTCSLSTVVLQPAHGTDAGAVFPPKALKSRASRDRRGWPFVVVVVSRDPDVKRRRDASRHREENRRRDVPSSSSTTMLTTRGERYAPSGIFSAEHSEKSPSGRIQVELSSDVPKVPAVRLAEQRRSRPGDAAPSLSIRGAASRTAAAHHPE